MSPHVVRTQYKLQAFCDSPQPSSPIRGTEEPHHQPAKVLNLLSLWRLDTSDDDFTCEELRELRDIFTYYAINHRNFVIAMSYCGE